MADTLKFEIVTPTATAYSADRRLVTLPAADGQLGIYPHHVPLLTRIVSLKAKRRRRVCEQVSC